LLALRRASASIDTVFRAERRAAKLQNVADCHQFAATCPGFAARLRLLARQPAMRLKRFNRCRFSSRSDSATLILPQAVQLHLT
jgi:hypothetical protein